MIHNESLTEKVNSYAAAYDNYDPKWGQEKEDKLRLWMFACRALSSNWKDKLSVHLGREVFISMGLVDLPIKMTHSELENEEWQIEFGAAPVISMTPASRNDDGGDEEEKKEDLD